MLFGLSLGGYVAAAVAALEPALAGVVVGVPVVDIPEIIRTNLRRVMPSATRLCENWRSASTR